jgi:hypothetical protein
MKTINRLGTFDDVLAASSEEVGGICRALRKLIRELHPDCVEVPRPGEPSSAYGFGEKKMSEAYAYIMPQKEYVNLGFYHGANIEEECPHLEGTGKKLRHIKILSLEMVGSPEIRKALVASIDERRKALNLTDG